MDPESVIKLFDSCWFNYEILKYDPNDSWVKAHKSELKYSSLRSILVRSQSEDIGSSSFNYAGSFPPNSVLKSIPDSRKLEYLKTQKQHEHEHEQLQEPAETTIEDQKKKKKFKRRHGMSKSLSDLEFEELKGFMDMGFVFSEQDKEDSSLVEIIPGLQRLGEDEGDDDDGGDHERRPYLSEAWANLDRKLMNKEHNKGESLQPMMNWEIPAVKDEIDMKDNLKLWAHTVASLVR